jgi:DMSO/TMAO reductase YedYZ molybdopterin-dependent catalytic subunit
VVASGKCAVPLPVVDDAVRHTIESGLVERPLELSLRDLTTLRSRTMVVTLECAGNGRSRLEPHVPGRVL